MSPVEEISDAQEDKVIEAFLANKIGLNLEYEFQPNLYGEIKYDYQTITHPTRNKPVAQEHSIMVAIKIFFQ